MKKIRIILLPALLAFMGCKTVSITSATKLEVTPGNRRAEPFVKYILQVKTEKGTIKFNKIVLSTGNIFNSISVKNSSGIETNNSSAFNKGEYTLTVRSDSVIVSSQEEKLKLEVENEKGKITILETTTLKKETSLR